MISYAKQLPRQFDPGYVWPGSGTSSPDTIGDPFGHRTFTGHASGVDIHRGTDHFDAQGGEIGKSPIHGKVIRRLYTHYPCNYDHSGELNESDPSSKATFTIDTANSRLRIVGKNDGTVAFASTAQYRSNRRFSHYTSAGAADDWMFDVNIQTALGTLNGKFQFGIYDPLNTEYVYMTYDGATLTAKGKQTAGVMTADGTSAALASKTWLRIKFTASTGQIKWQHSTDGSTWVDLATQGTIAFTMKGAGFHVFVGWDPAASAGDETVDLEFWGWWDAHGIGRFGNWVEIANASEKFLLMHFDHLLVSVGQEVRPGDSIGRTGTTGFDILSGRILTAHVHLEYIPNHAHDYSNADPTNPLDANILPRSSTSVSIGVVRDTAMSPLAVDSHRLTITVTRGSNQNFQINEFRLVGNTTSRTVNWNTRAGLDPADQDANNYDGVYFEPVAFDQASSTYVYKLYFSKAVVGATFSSAYVKDADGNTVWSE